MIRKYRFHAAGYTTRRVEIIADKKRKIAGFGDGPASFNYEATLDGFDVTSFDPIYQFSRDELKGRIAEVRETIMQQMAENRENYVWKSIKSLEELENVRISAMNQFCQIMKKEYPKRDMYIMSCQKDLTFRMTILISD